MREVILLIGAPASGKGTQAKIIEKKFGFKQLSSGDIIRANAKKLSSMSAVNSGGLIPDEEINKMISERLLSEDENILLDGYPRTLAQAEYLDNMKIFPVVVFYLHVSLPVLLDRVAGRLTAKLSGETYHLKYRPPKVAGFCDVTGEKLYVRDDDKPEVVEKRYATYLTYTEPLLNFYRNKGVLIEINAEQSIEGISADIANVLRKK